MCRCAGGARPGRTAREGLRGYLGDNLVTVLERPCFSDFGAAAGPEKGVLDRRLDEVPPFDGRGKGLRVLEREHLPLRRLVVVLLHRGFPIALLLGLDIMGDHPRESAQHPANEGAPARVARLMADDRARARAQRRAQRPGLAVALAEGRDLLSAVKYANCAGAITCTRLGVIPAMGDRETVDGLYSETFG